MIRNTFKKIALISTFIVSSLILTSCQIPFERFLGDDSNTPKEIIVEGIKETKPNKTIEDVNNYKEKLKSIFGIIGDNDFYLKNFNNKEGFYAPIKTFFDENYLSKIESGENKNILGKVIDNIYYKENTKFKEARIIGVGETLYSTKIEVEVVSIDDTTSFGIQYIDIYLNQDNLINDIILIADLTTAQNTTKEITDDSLLLKDNNEFINVFETFITPFKSKTIYDLSLNSEKQQDFEYEINVVLDNIEMQNKNNEVLKTLFKAGKASFDNYGIVEYMNYDKNAEPITVYKVRFSLEGELIDFTINYNRLEKVIQKISL